MVDENAFWAGINALDNDLAPPPGFLPEKDAFAERLCVDGGTAPARWRPCVAASASMVASCTGVSVVPGHTALHVTPVPTTSSATARVNPISAVFVVT